MDSQRGRSAPQGQQQQQQQQPTETSALLSFPSQPPQQTSQAPASPSSSSSSSLSTLLQQPTTTTSERKPSLSSSSSHSSRHNPSTPTPWAYIVHYIRQLLGADDTRRSNVGVRARMVSDAIIGLSDGLTVPFALTAGLSSVDGIAARTIVYGGLAELIAGAISMGLGGYLGARSELQSYKETRRSENLRILTSPSAVEDDVRALFAPYTPHLSEATLSSLTRELSSSPDYVDFVMEFHHGTPEPCPARALQSALMIALGYMLGGIVPLVPYFFVQDAGSGGGAGRGIVWALWVSVCVMAVALFGFGYVKTCVFTGWKGRRCVVQGCWGGVQMVVVGGAAAGSAVALVKLFEGFGGR